MGVLKIADIIINITSLGLVIGMFSLWAANYQSLPEKIPIHFCITGKADWWVKKTYLSAYFMPLIAAVIWPVIFVSFHLATGVDSEDTPPEFTLAGSCMAFAMTLLFFNISKGMIHVALGKAESIYKYLLPPFLLVMAFSGGLALFSANIGKRPPEFKSVTLCSAVDKRNAPQNISDTFPGATREIYAVAKWKYLNGAHKITIGWTAPDGSEPHGGLYALQPEKKMKFARRIPFTLDLAEMTKMGVDIRGKWTVKISLDGKEQATKSFEVRGE